MINYALLGQVRAWHGSWRADLSRQQQTLLAILVMERGAPVSRAGLARALWDEADPPEGGLKRVVSELRTRLRAAGPTADPLPDQRGDTYCLPLSERQADVLRFRSKIDQAGHATGRDATRLMREAMQEWGEDATGLFGGQPLTGLLGHWADSNREKLRAEYRDACLHCLRQDFDDQQYDHVVWECRQLANEPAALHDEMFLELWMIATYRAGHRTEVAQIIQRATESARTHLGWELSDRLRKLAEIIRDEDHSKLDGPVDADHASIILSRTAITRSPGPGPHTAQDSQEEGPDGMGESPCDSTHTDEDGKPEAGGETSNQHTAGVQPTLAFYGRVDAPHGVFGVQINNGEPR